MTDWNRAACLGGNPELWFADDEQQRREAVAICATCPIKDDCLQLALDAEGGMAWAYRYGIYGGMTARQRANMRTKAERVTQADHGTPAAYRRHLRHGEKPCPDCCFGQAEFARAYYAAKPRVRRAS